MVCRNKDKAEEAKEDIVTKSGNTVRILTLNKESFLKNQLIYEKQSDA